MNFTRITDMIIWMYWENMPGYRMPAYLRMCHEVVQRRCPNSVVKLVTPKTLCDYLPSIPFNLNQIQLFSKSLNNIALKADYIRVALLEKYGGMWLDIDCLVMKDVGERAKEKLDEYDFYGMKKTLTNGFVSNGLMASRPSGKVISEYLAILNDLIDNKLTNNECFEWAEIGAKVLTPVTQRYLDYCYFEPEEKIHPIHFKDHEIFWKRTDRSEDFDIIQKEVLTVMLYNARFSEDQKNTTRRQLLNRNCLLGYLMRQSFPEEVNTSYKTKCTNKNSCTEVKKFFSFKDVEIIFTTIARPKCCLEFIKSIRRILGNEVSVHFVVQGEPEGEYEKARKKFNCRITYVEKDLGLSASRNLLVENCDKSIVFLCDDDLIFDERIQLQKALDIISIREDIGVLGGMFENYFYDINNRIQNEKVVTNFNHIMWKERSIQKFLPVEYLEISREFVCPRYFIQKMDTVNNFALFRKKIFSEYGIRWEPKCKITGEHEKFYYDFHRTLEGKMNVYYTNLLITQHHRRSNPTYQKLRERNSGLKNAMLAMNVNQMLFYGKRAEFLQQDGNVHRTFDTFWRKP